MSYRNKDFLAYQLAIKAIVRDNKLKEILTRLLIYRNDNMWLFIDLFGKSKYISENERIKKLGDYMAIYQVYTLINIEPKDYQNDYRRCRNYMTKYSVDTLVCYRIRKKNGRCQCTWISGNKKPQYSVTIEHGNKTYYIGKEMISVPEVLLRPLFNISCEYSIRKLINDPQQQFYIKDNNGKTKEKSDAEYKRKGLYNPYKHRTEFVSIDDLKSMNLVTKIELLPDVSGHMAHFNHKFD